MLSRLTEPIAHRVQRDSASDMVHCRSLSKMIPQYLNGLRSRDLANVQGFAISMDSNSLLRTRLVSLAL